MPAAIAIPAIIGAVGSVAAAKIGSNAAQNAAQTQANAANQARQFQQSQFNQVLPVIQQGQQQAAAAYNPYQQIGNAALGTLYQRLGMRAPATGPAMPGQQLPFQAQPATMPPQMASTPWQAMTHPGQPAQYGIQPGMMPQGGFNLYGTGPR